MSKMNGAAVDFSVFVQAESIDYEVLGPDGVTGTGWTMTLAGPGHPKAQAYTQEQSKKNLRRQRQIEAAQVNGRKYVPEERSVDEQRRDNTAWVVSRILDWSPIKLPHITGNADPVPFSEEKAVEVLMHPTMGFVFAQLVDVVTEDKRFTPASGKTSGPGQSTTSA